MTLSAPPTLSKVLSMSSGRAWVRTWMVTWSGIRSSSMICLMKSKSVWDAEGKPTSISLKPMSTRHWNMTSFRSGLIGSISAWFPSRRSTLHHNGALVIEVSGQVRSLRSIGGNAWYLATGIRPGRAF